MLLRFALTVTLIEILLTAGASTAITVMETPLGYVGEADLTGLGLTFTEHQNRRVISMNVPVYETRATFSQPTASLFVSYRNSASVTDFEFRRSREELIRDHPERGEAVIINEPMPGERGYAIRHRGTKSVRFELVRLRGDEILIVQVVRKEPYETLPSAELTRCERRARVIQEHMMMKLRWRD